MGNIKQVKLKDIAKINNTTFCMNDFDEILYLDTSSVTKGVFGDFITLTKNGKIPSRAKRAVRHNTIIYSTVRPNLEHFGIFNQPPKNIVVSTGFATIDIKKTRADSKFVYYNLTQSIFTNALHTIAINNVSSYPSITPSDLENLELTLPPLPTQKSITRVLSQIDDKIELNRKINAELEAFTRTIYDWYFVQNRKRKWRAKTIKNLLESVKGGDWGKETPQGNYTQKVTCIRGTDINSLIGNDELKAPERYILDKNKTKFLTAGDFIIEISGGSPTQSTGRMAYILQETLDSFENPLICSNFCKAISLKDENLFYYFIFLWRELYNYGLFFGYEGKTSGIKNFLFDNFISSYKVVIPDPKTLSAFQSKVKPLFAQIVCLHRESEELAKLRDFLLPLLMNGEVEVN
jgi:type I restriction enzyme S subunit